MRPQTRDLIGEIGLFVALLGIGWFISIPTRAKTAKDKKARVKMGVIITSIGAGLLLLYFVLGLVQPRGYGPRGYGPQAYGGSPYRR